MKRISIMAIAILLGSTLFAIAQNPPQMPKPGPERRILATLPEAGT